MRLPLLILLLRCVRRCARCRVFRKKTSGLKPCPAQSCSAGVVSGAADIRQAWLSTRRIAGIKTLDNRLVSGELLAWD